MICYSRKRSFPSKSWEFQQCRWRRGTQCSMLNGRRTDWLGISSQSNHAEFRHWSVNKVGSQNFSDCTSKTRYCKSLSCRIRITVKTEEKSTTEVDYQRWWLAKLLKRLFELSIPLPLKRNSGIVKILISKLAVCVWHKWTGGTADIRLCHSRKNLDLVTVTTAQKVHWIIWLLLQVLE